MLLTARVTECHAARVASLTRNHNPIRGQLLSPFHSWRKRKYRRIKELIPATQPGSDKAGTCTQAGCFQGHALSLCAALSLLLQNLQRLHQQPTSGPSSPVLLLTRNVTWAKSPRAVFPSVKKEILHFALDSENKHIDFSVEVQVIFMPSINNS